MREPLTLDWIFNRSVPVPFSGCWAWAGSQVCGYGNFTYGMKSYRAHCVAYELANGPIPPGLEIDHLCRVKCCVNPDHLEAVSHKVNCARALSGVPKDEAHRARLAAARLGTKASPETKAKMSAARKGKPMPMQQRARMSASLSGRRLSAEHRANVSAARRAYEAARRTEN